MLTFDMKMKSHIVTPEYHIENENTDDERLLLQMTRDGDVNAFNRLFNKYWKKLYRIAYSKVGSREEAEEIVQDIFIKIWEKKSELNIHNLSAYLYTSVKNRCLNYIEKKIIEHKHWEYYKKFIIDYDDSTNKTIVPQVGNLAVEDRRVSVGLDLHRIAHMHVSQRILVDVHHHPHAAHVGNGEALGSARLQ